MRDLYYAGHYHTALYKGSTLVWERPDDIDARMVAWWQFDGSGTQAVVRDKSRAGNNLTLRNFAYAPGSGWTADGLQLEGVDDYAECPHSDSLALQRFTATICLTYKDSAKKQSLLSKSGLTEDYMFYYDARNASNRRIGMTLSDTDTNVAYDLSDGRRYQLAYTFDGTAGRIYVDGAEVATLSRTTPLVNSARRLLIGAYENMGASTMSTCIYHEVRLYNEALTAAEIGGITL